MLHAFSRRFSGTYPGRSFGFTPFELLASLGVIAAVAGYWAPQVLARL